LSQGKAIEDLSKVIEEMGEGENTPEKEKLKSKLVKMRKEWETKMKVVQEKTNSLSADVVHFKEYEQKVDQLGPLLQRMDMAVAEVENEGLECDDLSSLLEMLNENKVKMLCTSHFCILGIILSLYGYKM